MDQDVYYAGTPVVMGHIRRNGSNGSYYAMAEAYRIGAEHAAVVSTDPRDGQGRPLIGHSNLDARIWLSGAPLPRGRQRGHRSPVWTASTASSSTRCRYPRVWTGPQA